MRITSIEIKHIDVSCKEAGNKYLIGSVKAHFTTNINGMLMSGEMDIKDYAFGFIKLIQDKCAEQLKENHDRPHH